LVGDFHQDMTLVEYCGLRLRNRPREPQRGGPQQQQGHNIDFIRKAGKLTIPSFDGSSKCTARAWVHKLDTYYKLNQMIETEAISFATLHLEGEAHEWWHHGLVTLGHRLTVASPHIGSSQRDSWTCLIGGISRSTSGI
jgi:hypothetical protein